MGSLLIQYEINDVDQGLMLCDLNPFMTQANCMKAVNYTLGGVLDYHIYHNEDPDSPDYLIIGSLSSNSHYSLIRFFKDVSKTELFSNFRYVSEISASTLSSTRFTLDAMELFGSFLIFSNQTSLFLLDIEDYIDQPQWFTPKQVRVLCLNRLIENLSGGMNTEIDNIIDIHIEETCQEHLSVYIFTRWFGIIMLEVNKLSFYSNKWKTDPIMPTEASKNLNNNQESILDNFYAKGDSNYSIVAAARILSNYYDYDYTDMLYAVNNKMMGVLLRLRFEGGYHIYTLRIYNLLTHSSSIVYIDKMFPTINECKSILVEDDQHKSGIINFKMLCDSSIYLIDVSEKAEVIVNTKHSFWDNSSNKLMINVSQSNVFVNDTKSIIIDLTIRKEHVIEGGSPYLVGTITVISTLIISLLIVRFGLKE